MLRIRGLGRVPYGEALALQRALHAGSADDYLLVLEHPHVFTLGLRGDPDHILVDPAAVGADVVRCDRGGDVTYHGPGQLVAYPIVGVPMVPGAIPGHVHAVEQLIIDTLADLGLTSRRLPGYPGVWVGTDTAGPRKIAAVGVRVSRGRSLHGVALNVTTDLGWFERIVPCGIADKAVTSLAAEGVDVDVASVTGAGGPGRGPVGARRARRLPAHPAHVARHRSGPHRHRPHRSGPHRHRPHRHRPDRRRPSRSPAPR